LKGRTPFLISAGYEKEKKTGSFKNEAFNFSRFILFFADCQFCPAKRGINYAMGSV